MGEWLWHHQDRVGSHSQGRPQPIWSIQDDGQDQSTAPEQRSHLLRNPPPWIRGRGPREKALKKFHVCFYWLYEKGTTHAMVGLQGLHLGIAFRCPNVSASLGLKSFCPWCLKLGGNTKTIAIHLWEVHYRMTIMCDICQAFSSMSTQSILDHHLGCKAKCDKEHAGHEGPTKAPKKMKMSWGQNEASQLHGPDATKKSWWAECCSIFSV